MWDDENINNELNNDNISANDLSADSFLDAIGDMAWQAKENMLTGYTQTSTDLTDVELSDYPDAEMPGAVVAKVDELKAIIQNIENRPATTQVKLDKKYKINYPFELNNSQLTAATTINGPVLVIAGAGSGKTRVIVHRVAFMLENNIDPQEILLLTFTRKAASEMTARVQQLLQDNRPERIFGGTFHSFSNYVLRKYANILNIPPNFTIIDSEDSADTIDLVKSQMKMLSKEKAFPKKKRLQEIFSSARNRNIPVKEIIENEFSGLIEYLKPIELIFQGYEKYKRICNIFDYDDLMDVLRDALRDNHTFRQYMHRQFKYIMIDEYQDTNVVQKEIVEYLAEGHRNVLVVGDDAQSIYSFRGANYENILRFPQKYPNCKIVKIEENYRSNQRILDFTNAIIQNAKIGYKKKLFSNIKKEALPFVKKFYDQQTEAEHIVSKILEYREKGIALNQVAVLVRAFWHARYVE
ncbi:MAG TPA: ATP-dependent helicase, partial [Prolixibacteraceae bacterium]|nr:ATP-dependent helicase [Prolixibacteraceae bacterium]